MKKKEVKNDNYIIWWIIGLLLPFVGIVLYFIWKNKKKTVSKKLLTSSIIGFCIYSLIFLIFFGRSNENIGNGTIEEWYSDVTSGKEVVTVIGTSFCPHCQEYKPVIKALASKYKFRLYFFEFDTLPEEEKSILEGTYELKDFGDNVPFTFVINNNKYVSGTTGFSSREDSIEYLKGVKVIEN